MTKNSNVGSVVGVLAFAATCAAGLVATAYGVTIAYLMGASAQAQEDGTDIAAPQILLKNSLQQTLEKARTGAFGTISVEDRSVEVNSVEGEDAASVPTEVVSL